MEFHLDSMLPVVDWLYSRSLLLLICFHLFSKAPKPSSILGVKRGKNCPESVKIENPSIPNAFYSTLSL